MNCNQESGCPVQHKKEESGCPVKYKNPNQYNVYSQRIDPTNQMPAVANQQMAPNQEMPLSTDRVPSTIPKGGTDADTWTYPSPQMFWNALVRKNKSDGANEVDIDTVVAIHNNMNENTWKKVLSWEALHPADGPGREPKLLRFMGKPDDLSPKAYFKTLLGHPYPFDRHDWVVDRGGREVRYVIDYYHDESGVAHDVTPALGDASAMRSIVVDVRPALDSPLALYDRIMYMPFKRAIKQSDFTPLPILPPKNMKQAEDAKLTQLKQHWATITKTCAAQKESLKSCDSEESCSAAAVALQRCTANILCPKVVADFDACISSDKGLDVAWQNIINCNEDFALEYRNAMTNKK